MFEASQKGLKLFIEDGDPSQNSALARAAWRRKGARLMAIPTRSPDLNPIENIFHLLKRMLQQDAIKKNITFETYEKFSESVMTTFKNLNQNFIDNTIASMNNRIHTIIRIKVHVKDIDATNLS